MKVLVVLGALLLLGCSEKKEIEEMPISEVTTTPDVLFQPDASSTSSSYSFSKRGKEDVITQLFDEALQKDKELRGIWERVEKLPSQQRDSLAEYHKYSKINKEYWSDANRYISRLKDTVLRNKTSMLFKGLEESYSKLVESMTKEKTTLEILNRKLNDQKVILKLVVTHQMIKTYQKNEKPGLDKLKNMTEECMQLNKEIGVFIK